MFLLLHRTENFAYFVSAQLCLCYMWFLSPVPCCCLELKDCSFDLLLVQPESQFCSIWLDSSHGFVWFLIDKYILLIHLSKTQNESLT